MGKLLKAGADARHFLSQFRSLARMAELVDDMSGLENEVTTLEKRKEAVEKELLDLVPKLEAEDEILTSIMAATSDEAEAAAKIKTNATRAAAVIIDEADQSVREQCEKDMVTLKALQLQIREEQISFDSWHKEAEGSKRKILNDTSKLQKALDDLRAKLL